MSINRRTPLHSPRASGDGATGARARITARRSALRAALLLLLHLALATAAARAQEPTPRPAPDEADDVVRVETTLMQAGVTVLDKQGKFVEGLKAEQFELLVDGKPQPLAFFDRVLAGTAEEREKSARAAARAPAAAGASSSSAAAGQSGGQLPDQGRVVFFFVDDLHMTPESVMRARKAIEHYIDRVMGPNDVAAVGSASGQLGFLQQVTGNRDVLRAAAARLKPWQQTRGDGQLPAMTEYLAKAIAVEGDRDVLETYVQALMREGLRRNQAEAVVRGRAEAIFQAANAATRNTLRSLGSMVRAVSPMPGRKLVFFLSDGFLLSRQNSDISDSLQELTDAAVRAGFVLYTLDSRGLATESWLDAEAPLPADSAATLLRATRTEISASQEALHLLAEQTGGRALLHSNNLTNPLARAVSETATYYVLAWRPADGRQRDGKFRRLEVTVKDRPDLVVLVQGGFFEGADARLARKDEDDGRKEKVKPGQELKAALAAALPLRELPTHLDLSYSDPQKSDAVMTALVSVPLDALGPARPGAVEVEGYVVNLDGKIGSRFKERLTVSDGAAGSTAAAVRQHASYRHQVKLAPGIYQVRTAARDLASGRVGSAAEWIEIPDLRTGKLTLGSLIVGDRPQETGILYTAANFVSQRADHRFTRDSNLRLMTYIYNAARGPQNGAPDLDVHIEVLRGESPVMTYDKLKVDPSLADAAGIAYGAELPLYTLTPGRYALRLTVYDRVARVNASQRLGFTVE